MNLLKAPPALDDPAVAVADGEFGFDMDSWSTVRDNQAFAQSVEEKESGGQLREALKDVVVEEEGEQTDGQENAAISDSDVLA